MDRRLLVTGLAIAVAVISLLVLLVASDPRHVQSPESIKPIPLPETEEAKMEVVEGAAKIMSRYEIRRRTDDGHIQDLSADKYEPLPDGSVDVSNLRARIYTTAQRMIEIRADRGRIHAPNNKPRSGTLEDNVQIKLFNNGEGKPIDTSEDSSDVKLKCFLDEAHFEKELGKIDSNSYVQLTAARIEATGWGLHLTHSILDKRLAKLVGLRQGTLRFRPQSPTDLAATQRPRQTSGLTWGPQHVTTSQPPQHYLATFHDRVVIRSKDAVIHANQLQVVFNFGGGRQRDQLLEELSAVEPVEPWPTNSVLSLTHSAYTALAWAAAAAIAHPGEAPNTHHLRQRSMMPSSAEDITIQWHGRLTVTPIEPDASGSAELTGPDDMLVTLRGRPLRITTAKNETLLAASMDYLASRGRIRLFGLQQYPMVIDSPQLGAQISGSMLVVDQKQGTGVITGPGTLRAHDQPGLIEAIEPMHPWTTRHGRLPAGTNVQWADALDLSFYPCKLSSGSQTTFFKLARLRSALFRGDVEVRNPRFDLTTDRLSIELDDPADGKPVVKRILAVGNTTVEAKSDSQHPPLQVRSGRLTVELACQRDATVQPTRLLAQHQVVAHYKGITLHAAGVLDVSLTESSLQVSSDGMFSTQRQEAAAHVIGREGIVATPAPDEVAPIEIDAVPLFDEGRSLEVAHDEPSAELSPSYNAAPRDLANSKGDSAGGVKLVVRSLIAEQDVRLEIPDEQTLMIADRFVVDELQRLQLFGGHDRAARVERPDGTLLGPYIVMAANSKTARVIGPGQAIFFDKPHRILPGADPLEPSATDHPSRQPIPILTVDWLESMEFDNRYGLGQFIGDVVARSTQEQDTFLLTANDLRVELIAVSPLPREVEDQTGTADGQTALPQLARGNRTIKSLEARDEVEFLAEKWADWPGGKLATSVQIKGPNLVFDRVFEHIKMRGEGSMVYLDRRETSDKPSVEQGTFSPWISFEGRGDTLFEWIGGLTLDANHNKMVILDRVEMVHRPLGEDEVVQMVCQRLEASLKSTGGLSAWLGRKVPRPSLATVTADGNVLVQHGDRRASADHLRYTGSHGVVRLDAQTDRTVQVSDDEIGTLTGRSILWHPRTGKFRILELGPTRVGLGQ